MGGRKNNNNNLRRGSHNHPDWGSCNDTRWEVGHGGTANADGLSPLLLYSDTTPAYTSALKGGQKVLEIWSMAWPAMLKLMTAATVTQLWCYSRKVTKESQRPGRKCWEASPAALTHGHTRAPQLSWRGCCLSKGEKFPVLTFSLWPHRGVVSYLLMSQLGKHHASS